MAADAAVDAAVAAAHQRFQRDAGKSEALKGKKLLAVAMYACGAASVPLEQQLPLALAITGGGRCLQALGAAAAGPGCTPACSQHASQLTFAHHRLRST
jgi:hypothetical protein